MFWEKLSQGFHAKGGRDVLAVGATVQA